MKKNDLKTGMSFEFRNGKKGRVLRGLPSTNFREGDLVFGLFPSEFMSGDSYTEDLKYDGDNREYDIVKIYDKESDCNLMRHKIVKPVIFDRTQTIEITVKVNGKEVPINTISEETLLKIRNA